MPDESSTTAADLAAPDRAAAVQQLYLRNFDLICELVSSDPTLSFETSEKITQAITQYLDSYFGPMTDDVFRQWVADAILPAVCFASIYEHCRGSVRSAIRKILAVCLDLGVTVDHFDDAEQNTWLWVWQHLGELRNPAKSKAKTKTRLYSVAKFQALTIRKSLLRARDRLSNVELIRIGQETTEFGVTTLVIEPKMAEPFNPYTRSETVGEAA